jgi:hypothetical protein
MKKEIESAYERLPKLLTTYGFKKAYVRNENEYLAIVLCEQEKPLSLSAWLEFETFAKLDISRNIILIGHEQIDNLDSYLLIKGSESNDK